MKRAFPFPRLVIVSLCACLAGSCCNRPYAAGSQTWPHKNRYPQGPYEFVVRCYRVQAGICPEAGDKGAKVTILIWDFDHRNLLFEDRFVSDLYFEDIYAGFAEDGSVVVMDDKSGMVIRKYRRISDKQWRCPSS